VRTQPSRFDSPFGSHTPSADRPDYLCRRANVVGRITLYSLMIFFVFFTFSRVSSTLGF
jgi:hypothetical protein